MLDESVEMESRIGKYDIGTNTADGHTCRFCKAVLSGKVEVLALKNRDSDLVVHWFFCDDICMGKWMLWAIETYDSVLQMFIHGVDGYREKMESKLAKIDSILGCS